MSKLYCLCCDFKTLEQVEDICPVCFWEHEYYHIHNIMPLNVKVSESEIHKVIDIPTATNHGISLRQGRESFVQFGACEAEMIEHVRLPREDEK